MNNRTTAGMTLEQIEQGTPENKKLILKSFYKDDKCTIAPAKDINGRYKGIIENIPETEKMKRGYTPDTSSKMKIYDGMEIDLTDDTWRKDWEWMKYCVEIAEDFEKGQATPGAYFYIHRPGVEAAKNVSAIEREVHLMNYIIKDSAENLYNRASMLGFSMTEESISDVKELLLGMVKTAPKKIAAVYESKTYALELLLMHALEKKVVTKSGGVYVFGEILLGVDKRATVAFFANPKNISTTRAIESLTYGTKKQVVNPLADEVVSYEDKADDFDETHTNDIEVNEETVSASDNAKDHGIGADLDAGEGQKNEMLDQLKDKVANRNKKQNKK